MDKNTAGNEEERIPIVFATNDAYAIVAGVAIYSMVSNAKKSENYDIYILQTNLSKEHQRKLKHLERDNVKITIMDVKDYVFGSEEVSSEHLTIEAVYRLLIPELFPYYDKVLYLDCDIIVEGDISQLYYYDIGNCILGAAHCYVDEQREAYCREHLNLPYTEAFNSGVLLINLKRFREENIKEKCRKMLEEDWKRKEKKFLLMDQDVLNITCMGQVAFFSAVWNFPCGSFLTGDLSKVYDEYKEDFKLAYKLPKLLHYTTDAKPWHNPSYFRGEVFWKYARETEFYEELLYTNIAAAVLNIGKSFEKYSFPFNLVGHNKKIVLYGAGKVGKAFFSQIMLTKWCTLLAWVDRNYQYIRGENFTIESPAVISEMLYDYVLIAIEDENAANGIKDGLIRVGIPKEKIIWESPLTKVSGERQ